MTKKECFLLSRELCRTVLRSAFRSPDSFGDNYFKKDGEKDTLGSSTLKKVYEQLAPLLVTEEGHK